MKVLDFPGGATGSAGRCRPLGQPLRIVFVERFRPLADAFGCCPAGHDGGGAEGARREHSCIIVREIPP